MKPAWALRAWYRSPVRGSALGACGLRYLGAPPHRGSTPNPALSGQEQSGVPGSLAWTAGQPEPAFFFLVFFFFFFVLFLFFFFFFFFRTTPLIRTPNRGLTHYSEGSPYKEDLK